MIKSWLFEFFHQPLDEQRRSDPQAVHDHFRWYLDLWTRADSAPSRASSSASTTSARPTARRRTCSSPTSPPRTTRLRLGVLGSVSPYATPWRIVEEIAMLDHLTDGRLEIGVVSGIPPELAVVGITGDVAAGRHAEILDVLDAALTGSGRSPITACTGTSTISRSCRAACSSRSRRVWTAVRTAASAERPAGAVGRRAADSCRPRRSARSSTPYRAGCRGRRATRTARTRSPCDE